MNQVSRTILFRRRGQALLLAVLLMVFAALLGAAFITVIALNLNQTARQSDKNRAIEAAKSGLNFVNRRLTLSEKGDHWQPQDDSPIPTVTAPDYPLYYSNFDRAQGWAGQFAKFPDPRRPSDDAPQFMARVERVPFTLPASNPDHDKAGALKISVIGLAPDDPSVFHRLVAYKGGVESAPLARVMRTVSNWDFQNSVVPVAQVARFATPNIILKNNHGEWPEAPFNILIGDPQSGQVRGAVVSAITPGGDLTLADPAAVTPVPDAEERVELAAALGAGSFEPNKPSAVDFDNSGTVDYSPSGEKVSYAVSQGTAPGSVRVNGGLWWQGDSLAVNLLCSSDAFGATLRAPGSVRASGLMAMQSATSSEVFVKDALHMTSQEKLLDSATNRFPGSGGGWDDLDATQKDELVSDGWNRLSESHSARRSVKPFSPPDLTAGEDSYGRYRRLTKFSTPRNGGDPLTASSFGNGIGLYIDNPGDRERVYDTTNLRLRDMTQSELVRMWLSPTTATDAFVREATLSATTQAPNAATASLEEKHLRGWVGPDEFRARGALVELFPDGLPGDPTHSASVAVTLEHRTDTGSPLNRGWRDSDGNLQGNSLDGGVYRQEFPWPQNGVIFAEGNLRIRGGVASPDSANTNVDPGRSLTVVSMSNIYIEGSINAGGTAAGRKLLLLARKNVVVNPTRVISRVDVQSRAAADSGGPQTSISLYDASVFQKGDWIITPAGASSQILGVSGNTLTLETALDVSQNDLIASLSDPKKDDPAVAGYSPLVPYTDRSQISNFGEVLQRRFPTGGQANVRLALRHGAERRDAMSIAISGGSPATAALTVKKAANPQNQLIQGSEKTVVIAHPAPDTDTFPSNPAANPTDDLTALVSQMNSQAPAGTPTPTWRYNASLISNFGSPTPSVPAYPVPLYHFLASVGNRKNIGGAGINAFPSKELVDGTNLYRLPLATSVTASLNNDPGNAVLQSDHWGTGLEGAAQLGFSPNQADPEDATSADQSFYTPYPGGSNILYVLDSRVVSDATPPARSTLAFRFNDAVKTLFPSDANAPDATNRLPFYWLSRLKVENSTLDDGAGNFVELKPGNTLDIRAFVYAQEGSWFVIPGPFFDPNVHNNDDTNRDGMVSADEQLAAYRFHRYNYAIQFHGAIMENQTAIINAAGPVLGAVGDWTDKWATYNSTQTAPHDVLSYTFDPSVVRGGLANDPGFLPPQSLDLIYQEAV